MKEKLKNSFYICFISSLIFHVVTIFYDQIKLEWQFELSEEQNKTIEVLEQNQRSVAQTKHRKQDKDLLVEYMQEQKEKFIKDCKEQFLKEQQVEAEGEEIGKEGQKKEKGGLAEVAKNFAGFLNKDKKPFKKKMELSKPLSLTYLGSIAKENSNYEPKKCNGKFYVGLGLSLDDKADKKMRTIKDLMDYSPWRVVAVAKGYVADKNNIGEGDIFLGVKDSQGKFWEGNRLIAKGVPAGTVVEALFRQKNGVVSKSIRLEEICYEEVVK